MTDTLKLEDKTFILRQIWHLGPSLTPTTRFKSHLFGLFFLTGTLLVKYDNHKRACVRRAPINALSAFSWLSIRSRRQQQGSLIWREWGGGPRALYLWPRSEPGASERLLSAWSVLINIPSSQVMINANPIGCASDESPVSQNEVGLRLPRWSPSSSRSALSNTMRAGRAGMKRTIFDISGWEMASLKQNQKLRMEEDDP